MKMKPILSTLIGLLILIILLLIYMLENRKTIILPSYFKYTKEELAPLLQQAVPTTEITRDDLTQWDDKLFDLIRKTKITDYDASRTFAYFFTAQRDAAYISYNLHQKFAGSLAPISKAILCIFFPDDCKSLSEVESSDPYSQAIADIVLAKVKERINEDKLAKPYKEKTGDQYWAGERPYGGEQVVEWKTWLIKSPSQFRSPPPPDYNAEEWKKQLSEVEKERKNVSDTQKEAVVYWAGGPGTLTPLGIWLDIADRYLWQKNFSVEKILLVQSTLAMGMADAIIAVFDSKYIYMVKRPFMRDPNLITIMPTPNYPSYPAGHSVVSMAAATILSHFLPEEQKQFFDLASQASHSRVWGGIHFPIDTELGEIMGKEVGKAALNSLEKLPNN